jgi:cellulose synthase/poly-beta-1,6-N-acetylglucosamine synthase-like glycosyltransferase
MVEKIGDYNKIKNIHTTKSIKLKSELDVIHEGKYRQKTNKYIPVISLFFAILITVLVGLLISTGASNMSNLFTHETILDEPELLHALQAAQASGVTMATHGWEHENYSELTPAQAIVNLEKSRAVFEQSGLNLGLFVAPYEITGIPDDAEVVESIENEGFDIGTIGEPVYEYTWLWRNMSSFDDPRFQAASIEIRKQKPKVIVFHAQDWNEYTEQFFISYLTSTNEKDIIVRMDDIIVSTPKEVINDVAKLTQYESISEVVFAIIPSGMYDSDDPVVYNIKVNDIMKIYFLFFIIIALLPLSFFVIWKFLSSWNMRQYKNNPQTEINARYPELVSVLVPAYNEEKSIGRCIEALLCQDYGGAMEIIVINDGSSDRTAEIILTYPVKFIDLKKNGGKANALNRGIEEAKGDILVFTDSDSNMVKDTISCLVQTFMDDSDAQMVTGTVLINNPEKSSGMRKIMIYCQMIEYHLEQEIMRYLQGLGGNILVCPGPSTAVRRSVCEVVKFSDDTIVEDADFTVNVLQKSMKVVQNLQAKVYTNAPETLGAWYKQRKRWWFGYLQVWKIHRQWSAGNTWMVYNYLSYIISVCSIIMILLTPYFLLQYNNVTHIAFRGLLHIIIPVLLYIVLTGWLFGHDKKLLLMLIPYVIIYSTFRVFVLSYIYICYLTGMGLKIKFGSRTINAK